jgi:hypothetical protein
MTAWDTSCAVKRDYDTMLEAAYQHKSKAPVSKEKKCWI